MNTSKIGFNAYKISNYEIDRIAFREDFDKFIPYNVVKDLVQIWALAKYGKLEELYDYYFPPYNPYSKQLKELISFVDFTDATLPDSGITFALQIVSIISDKVNLRKLDRAKGNMVKVPIEEGQQNYPFDLNSIEDSVLSYFGINIDDTDPNKVSLPKDIQNVLKFYYHLSNLPGYDDKVNIMLRTNMKAVHQLVKITNKWKIKYPNFKGELALKHFRVKIPKMEKKTYTDVTLLIDVSYSVFNNEDYKALLKSVLLYYYNKFTPQTKLYLYLFGHSLYEVKLIEKKEDIISFLNAGLKGIIDYTGWHKAFDQIFKQVSSDHVILLTDGSEDDFPLPKDTTRKWSVITLENNPTLVKLVRSTNGTLITLNR